MRIYGYGDLPAKVAPQATPSANKSPRDSFISSPAAAARPQNSPLPAWASELANGLTRTFRMAASPESLFQRNPLTKIEVELKQVESFEPEMAKLQTPAQFSAKTQALKTRVEQGASLEEIRPEAYAVARRAAEVALKLRPYDSQMKGSLAMDHGRIAQMGTGEGKTLTALMPLYLSSLAGRGSHLVTVNDFLAQSGYEQNKPALDLLGVSTGMVLKDMTAEQKRAGYGADVTYLSNDTLGFDYLHDKTTRDPNERVQRQPYAALVDEVDQVLLDEARVPLIIARPLSAVDNQKSQAECVFFKAVVDQLEPGADYRVNREDHTAMLTEHGEDVVANEVSLLEARQRGDSRGVQAGVRLRGLLRQIERQREEPPPPATLGEKLSHLLEGSQPLPEEILIMQEHRANEKELLNQEKDSLQKQLPPTFLYSQDNSHRLGFLKNALDARALFSEGRDYAVEDGKVQIVDEFKGRISEGRRFSEGLHQALEAKEGVDIQPETETVASITYPNLLGRYERLAGMTGTAQSAAGEFRELLGLQVVDIPPNQPSQRVDHPDRIYATDEDRMKARCGEIQAYFEEGVPVLVATRSVAVNKFVSQTLSEMGVPNQALNAEDVKTNTPQENEMVQHAGLSGAVTVATNMAGRGVDIKPDSVNFKKLFLACHAACAQGKNVVVDLERPEQFERLQEWCNLPAEAADKLSCAVQGLQVRISAAGSNPPSPEVHLKAADFPGKKLVVLAIERNLDRRIDDQLRGRAGRQGAPGETQFALSLQDDLLRIYGSEQIEKIRPLIGKDGAESNAAITRWVEEAQAKAQRGFADGRLHGAKFDQIANHQREIVWSFRDALVDQRPDVVAPSETIPLDVKATALEWVSQSWNEALSEELGGKTHPKPEKLQKAMDAVAGKLGFALSLSPDTKDQPLSARVSSAAAARYQELAGSLPEAELQKFQWKSMLDSLDSTWTNHLSNLETLKNGANLETYAGKEAIQAYKELTGKAFDRMWKQAHKEFATELMTVMEHDAAAARRIPGYLSGL